MGKRRLGDLYRTHTLVECDDGQGEKIAVSLVKISRPDTDAAVLAANAARARVLMRRGDRESDLWLEAYGEVADRPRDHITAVLVADDLSQKRLSAEAQEEAEERWAEDEYLDGLRKLWKDSMMEVWAVNPDDPDAKRVRDELAAFKHAVDARMAGEAEDLTEGYAHLDEEELRIKVTDKLIENAANSVWVEEFERHRIFYATRDPLDRSKRYFRAMEEVRDLDDRVYTQLRIKYDNLALDSISGKESPATTGSSPPSDRSDAEEGSKRSGHETSTASKNSPTSS